MNLQWTVPFILRWWGGSSSLSSLSEEEGEERGELGDMLTLLDEDIAAARYEGRKWVE